MSKPQSTSAPNALAAFVPDPIVPLSNVPPGDATEVGSLPRNCFIGSPQKNMDFTIGKTFNITERNRLRFRADYSNLTLSGSHGSYFSPSIV